MATFGSGVPTGNATMRRGRKGILVGTSPSILAFAAARGTTRRLTAVATIVEKHFPVTSILGFAWFAKWRRTDRQSSLPSICRATDQPVAALLQDLKQRGLLDDTLVLWGGEFGRTPTSQDRNGRDHNPFGFTMWMAGGGLKKGISHGETDEFGYHAVENRVSIHDLHATILHLLGLNHEELTFRYGGREQSLVSGLGDVVTDILA